MSRSYPPDLKAATMALLERNRGNIQMTAQQTGVPERTLHDWKGDIAPYMQQFFPANVSPMGETPMFENDLEALAFIRQNIIGELSRLSASLQHDPGFTTPYQRALVMSQLMDKLLKLDLHIKPYIPREAQKIRIEFMDEHGNIHNQMPSDDEDDGYIVYEGEDDIVGDDDNDNMD